MISKKEVKHIANLARIGMGKRDVDKFSKELSSILDWVERLKEVDVTGVEPTAHIMGLVNITRQDKAEKFENKEGIVKLFPEEKGGYDKVKSVL
jgi:aspartyl-tRNA(Asn)/glutamyl-tRNA(Gln) amidotransferase subunit C